MTPPACDTVCGEQLRAIFRSDDIDVHVTHVPPLIPSPYEPLNMRCPHGVPWYAEPTSEQRAAWARDGAA